MSRVLTIILAYNNEEDLLHCIESVSRSGQQSDILLINNGLPFVNDYNLTYECKVIFNKINLGFGKSCNQGFEYAVLNNYDFVLLLNQDAVIERDTLGLLINTYNSNSNLFILSPLDYSSCNLISDYMLRNMNLLSINELIHSQFPKTLRVHKMIAAACWLISVRNLKNVGGFNPLFPHYGEDNELFERSGELGYLNSIDLNSKYFHRGHNSVYANNGSGKMIELNFTMFICLEIAPRINEILKLNLSDLKKFIFMVFLIKKILKKIRHKKSLIIEISWAFFFVKYFSKIFRNLKVESNQFKYGLQDGLTIDDVVNFKLFRKVYKN